MSSTLCRVCTANCNSGFLSLTETCCSPAVTYVEAFNVCTALDAAAGDEFPQSLCPACCKQLQTAYEFVRKARHTDDLLRGFRTKRESSFCEDAPAENCEDPLQSAQEYDVFGEITSEDWLKSDEESHDATDSDDDDDNTPLRHLLPAEHFISNQLKIRSNADLLEKPFVDDVAAQPIESTLILPQGEQIFPQGVYQCTECDKHYFTNAGLEAHNEIHVPKGVASKKKRIQRPRKKSSKNAKDNDEDNHALVQVDQVQKCHPSNDEAAVVSQVNEKPAKRQQKKPPKPKKLFPCHVCGKQMISASKLRYHMVMHTGQKDFLCTICPKAYSTIYALKHHIRTHTGERPYECKFCGDKFLRPTTLKSHMRRHTGERPYGCSVCGKRFIQHSSMTTHMKLNHMAKTIQCPHCDKKYARQTDLNTHLLSHTGNKPFSCSLCPSRFIRQANLNKHLNQQHFTPKASKKIPTQSKAPPTAAIECKTETLEGDMLPYNCSDVQLAMPLTAGDDNESAWPN